MRLTLRTLLAYLDGILEPNDAQDLSKKIEESQYASSLVHRIRDVLRRLRLGAPHLNDRSSQFDPNTVAEYLDNTLDSEGVTSFEKVCLDSDTHLAEVAACHQILTLVLGEPAEIDPASRQRMYVLKDVPSTDAPPPPPVPGTTTIVAAAASSPTLDLGQDEEKPGDRKPRPKPTVPEYLRESRGAGRRVPMVATCVVVLCFIGMLLTALGQFEPGTPLGNMLVQWGVREAPKEKKDKEVAVASPVKKPQEDEKQEPAASPENPPSAAEEKPVTPPPSEPEKDAAKETPAPMPTEPPKQPPAIAKEQPIAPPAESAAEKPAAPALATPPKPVEPPATANIPKADKPETPAAAPPSEKPSPDPASKLPVPTDVAGNEKDAGKSAAPPAMTPAASDASPQLIPKTVVEPDSTKGAEGGDESQSKLTPAPLPPESLGRLVTADQVLLREDARDGWVRVATSQGLLPQRLLVLPTYRARVALTVGVSLEILGDTLIELLPGTPQEYPGIRILYGRVVLMPSSAMQANSRLRVAFGRRTGVLAFHNADSIAAFDVRRIREPGTNPEVGPPVISAALYASTGSVFWEETIDGDAKSLKLASPQWVSFKAALTSEPAVSKELPSWIVSAPISALDRRASAAIAQLLPTDRSARLGLLELATSRPQKEVRWLALRSLSYVGQFNDLVTALNDPAYRLEWPEYIEQLRASVARDASTAESVRQALEKAYPQQSADLYRMLWGYSDEDLQEGGDKALVKALEHDVLAMRVLGYWNLKDLTGVGASYKPEQPAAKRQQPIRRWSERLNAGEIRVKSPEKKAAAAAQDAPTPK